MHAQVQTRRNENEILHLQVKVKDLTFLKSILKDTPCWFSGPGWDLHQTVVRPSQVDLPPNTSTARRPVGGPVPIEDLALPSGKLG